jgi:hypothetical protein
MRAATKARSVGESYNYERNVGHISVGIALCKELPPQAQKAYYFRLPEV